MVNDLICSNQLRVSRISSIVDEGIRAILNLFIYLFFFLQEDFTYKRTKTKKAAFLCT